MARMAVAGPVTQSPPAKTASACCRCRLELSCASITFRAGWGYRSCLKALQLQCPDRWPRRTIVCRGCVLRADRQSAGRGRPFLIGKADDLRLDPAGRATSPASSLPRCAPALQSSQNLCSLLRSRPSTSSGSAVISAICGGGRRRCTARRAQPDRAACHVHRDVAAADDARRACR